MALNGTTMGEAVAAAVKTVADGISETGAITADQMESIWVAACIKIVEHIQSNGIVTGTVTTGSGSGGSVSGTIT